MTSGPQDIELEDQIRQRAYELYAEGSREEGHELEDWYRAKEKITIKKFRITSAQVQQYTTTTWKSPGHDAGAFSCPKVQPVISVADSSPRSSIGGASSFMPNKRRNPTWGRPMQPASVLCTEFEMQVKHLRLAPEEYVASSRLRQWCEANKNLHYIPEWLLKAWNISVNSDLTGAA